MVFLRRFAIVTTFLSMTLGGAACSGQSTSSGDPGAGASSVAESPSADVGSAFLGTWTYASDSSNVVSCFLADAGGDLDASLPFDGGGVPMQGGALPITGAITITRGEAGKLAVASDDGCAAWTYDVDARVATATTYQSCPNGEGPQGTTFAIVLEQSTLTLSADGASIIEDTAEQAYGICTEQRHATLARAN